MYLLFAWRYLKAKKTTNAINIISWVSMMAIAFGAGALVLVLSAFNGFEGLVKSLYSSFYTDLKILPEKGKVISLSPEQIAALRGFSGVKNISLVAEEQALLQNGEYQSIVTLKGVDSNFTQITGLSEKVIRGEFNTGTADEPGAVMGAGVENAVGVEADRSLLAMTVYLSKRGVGNLSLESLSAGNIVPTGSFLIQQEFDNKYVITNTEFVKLQLGLDSNQFTGVEIGLVRPGDAEKVKEGLQQFLGSGYLVRTRYEQNQSLYTAMRLEKWAIYIILSLVLGVAAFTIVGALTMLVLEKQKDISVLKAMGAANGYIRNIFLGEGFLVGLIGSAIGFGIALLLIYLQVTFKLIKLPGTSFLIDYYPVEVKITDFLLVFVTIMLVTLLASWVPARKAARQDLELK